MKTVGVSLLLVVALLALSANAFTLKKMLDAVNKARTNPTYYATFIKTEYKDKTVNGVHKDWNLKFNEGTPAVFDEAIAALNAQATLGTMTIDLGMSYATFSHCKYLGNELKSLSHTGKGGSSFSDRLKEYTSSFNTFSGEVLLSNSITSKTEEHLVADWIIDDGVSGRGHRAIVLGSNYNVLGVGLYTDSSSKTYAGMTFAGKFDCDKCTTINCDMKKDCGWSQYLTDTSQKNECFSGILSAAVTILVAVFYGILA